MPEALIKYDEPPRGKLLWMAWWTVTTTVLGSSPQVLRASGLVHKNDVVQPSFRFPTS
jgi:hypothetical protein